MTTEKPDPDRSFIIATGNPGKRREFERLLATFVSPEWDIYDRSGYVEPLEEIEETAETFRGNAIKKAVETSRQTGLCALADDSGLEVDALDGAPGVYSARFAGEDATDDENNRLLVSKLRGVPSDQRSARFVCVIALALPDNDVADQILSRQGIERDAVASSRPAEAETPGIVRDRVVVWFRGGVEGKIVDEPAGDRGFGYDPHFFVPDEGQTFAQMPTEHKNRISHRADAAQKLVQWSRG